MEEKTNPLKQVLFQPLNQNRQLTQSVEFCCAFPRLWGYSQENIPVSQTDTQADRQTHTHTNANDAIKAGNETGSHREKPVTNAFKDSCLQPSAGLATQRRDKHITMLWGHCKIGMNSITNGGANEFYFEI